MPGQLPAKHGCQPGVVKRKKLNVVPGNLNSGEFNYGPTENRVEITAIVYKN